MSLPARLRRRFSPPAASFSALGCDAQQRVTMRHVGADQDALSAMVGAAARLTVHESGALRFARCPDCLANARGSPGIAPNDLPTLSPAAPRIRARQRGRHAPFLPLRPTQAGRVWGQAMMATRTTLDALRARRDRTAETADQLAALVDRLDGTPAAAALRQRLKKVVVLIDAIDRMIFRRSGGAA